MFISRTIKKKKKPKQIHTLYNCLGVKTATLSLSLPLQHDNGALRQTTDRIPHRCLTYRLKTYELFILLFRQYTTDHKYVFDQKLDSIRKRLRLKSFTDEAAGPESGAGRRGSLE